MRRNYAASNRKGISVATHAALSRLALALAWASCAAAPLAAQQDLSVEQAQLSEKYDRLEALAVRIAEVVEVDNPDRAEQLRAAIARSRELALQDRFDAIVGLLEQERFAAAARDQTQLADNLETLLTLLLADPQEARLEAERRRLREAAKEVGRLIREQRALRSEAIDGDDPQALAGEQGDLAEDVGRVEEALQPDESGAPREGDDQPRAPDATPPGGEQPEQAEPGESEPSPSERAAQRLSAAKSAMKRAAGRLSQGDAGGAAPNQSEAQRELEQAKAELEEALRQVREEEAERMLTRLATRLRRILSEQTEINRLTLQTQEIHGDEVTPQKRSAAAGLARREDEATSVADGAIRLIEEDGRSLAFLEVLEQVREDMRAVSQRLMKADTADLTQQIERDIVEALEEAVSILDAQLAEMANQKTQPPGQGSQTANAGEQRLVDPIHELRMIRALQKRILDRTRRFELLRAEDQIDSQELSNSLSDLAQRQRRAMEAARKLGSGEW